jgi:hypothetical protein
VSVRKDLLIFQWFMGGSVSRDLGNYRFFPDHSITYSVSGAKVWARRCSMRSQSERRPWNSAIFWRQTAERHGLTPNLPGVLPLLLKRWAVESLFRTLKHGFGLKDAWQQSRQVLMRWVTVVAAGYALNQMLAFTDPARLAGLAKPAPWRAPGTRTAGLIQAGIARILREVGRPAFIAAIWGKNRRRCARHRRIISTARRQSRVSHPTPPSSFRSRGSNPAPWRRNVAWKLQYIVSAYLPKNITPN